MATVVFSGVLGENIGRLVKDRESATGEIEIAADNIRSLINALDDRFPGIGDKLRSGVAIAIDGEIIANPLLETLETDSEVYFIPAIEAG